MQNPQPGWLVVKHWQGQTGCCRKVQVCATINDTGCCLFTKAQEVDVYERWMGFPGVLHAGLMKLQIYICRRIDFLSINESCPSRQEMSRKDRWDQQQLHSGSVELRKQFFANMDFKEVSKKMKLSFLFQTPRSRVVSKNELLVSFSNLLNQM